MWEKTDQKNFDNEYFLHSERQLLTGCLQNKSSRK